MTMLLNEGVMVAMALPLVVVVAQVSHIAHKRLRSYAMARCICYISNLIMAEEEPSDEELRIMRLRFSAGVVLDSVHFVAEKIYGNALNRLALIVEVCEIDYYLIEQIHRTRGWSRVGLLAKFSALTHATAIVGHAEVYMEEDNREIRFYAMAALVAARPDRAMRYIMRFSTSLTLREVAILTQLLRRAGAPIAYTPLLLSQNRNLQLLGIYLSGHFSIVDAEPHLQRLVESEDNEVSYMALQTLCSIRGDMSTAQVGKAVKRLAPHERNSFILYAVQNCYSLRSCSHLLTSEERRLFAQLMNSYKCRMVCN